MVDFEMMNPLIIRLNEVDPKEILYSIQGFTNSNINSHSGSVSMEKSPGSLLDYKKKFDKVLAHLEYGDTFLTNLTVTTEVKLGCSLHDIFSQSEAKYKLLFKNQFLVFSPETFVQIKDGKIYAYPDEGHHRCCY